MARIIEAQITSYIILSLAFILPLNSQETGQPPPTASPASTPGQADSASQRPPQARAKVFITGRYTLLATYDRFYATTQTIGTYELVADPAQADLIFELVQTGPWHCIPDPGPPGFDEDRWTESYDPYLTLTVLNRKSHAQKEKYETGVESTYLRTTAAKKFAQAIEKLAKQASRISVATAIASPERPNAAPVPAPLGSAKTVFISDRVYDSTSSLEKPGEIYTQVYSAMKNWGRYKLVSSAADAELLLELKLTQDQGPECRVRLIPLTINLTITEPNTNTMIWGFGMDLPVSQLWRHRNRLSASQKNEVRSVTMLVDQIREMVARADAEAAASELNNSTPSQKAGQGW